MKVWRDWLHHWRCLCYRKIHEAHQAWNSKSLLEKTGADVYDFTGLTMEPVGGHQWKWLWIVTKRVAGDEFLDLGEIQDSTPEELTDNCFWIRARLWGRRCRRSARKQTGIRRFLAEGFRLLEAWCWLLLGLYDTGTGTKQIVEEVLVSFWRKWECRKARQNEDAFL